MREYLNKLRNNQRNSPTAKSLYIYESFYKIKGISLMKQIVGK